MAHKSKSRSNGTELAVFKGREARLNHALLRILVLQSPQTVYELHKEVTKQKTLKHVHYASVNKRTKALEELGYIENVGSRKTKAGFNARLYEITIKGYLVLALRTTAIEDLIARLDEAQMLTAIGLITTGLSNQADELP